MGKINEEIANFLKNLYPIHGKKWCQETLSLTEAQVRQFAYKNRLRLKQGTEFWKDFQMRAAISKIGKKRPLQSAHAKRLWAEGIFKSQPKGKRNAKWIPRVNTLCEICSKTFQGLPQTAHHSQRFCSKTCLKKWRKIMWILKPHPRGMLGKNHTDKARVQMSKKRKGLKHSRKSIILRMKTLKAKGKFAPERHNVTWKGGRSEDLGDRWFRSRWERNYARYLNFLVKQREIEKWEYEAETFWFEKIRRGTVSYLPDFKVTKKDGTIEYHEVKGWMDDRSKTKLKRMKKYYPEVKIVLVDGDSMKALNKHGSLFSEHWEKK